MKTCSHKLSYVIEICNLTTSTDKGPFFCLIPRDRLGNQLCTALHFPSTVISAENNKFLTKTLKQTKHYALVNQFEVCFYLLFVGRNTDNKDFFSIEFYPLGMSVIDWLSLINAIGNLMRLMYYLKQKGVCGGKTSVHLEVILEEASAFRYLKMQTKKSINA